MRVIRTSLLGWLALAAAACGGEPRAGGEAGIDPGAVPEADRFGGTVVIGGQGDVQSMNALVTNDYMSAQLQNFVLLMPLVRYDDAFQPQPYLAESWELGPDGNEIVFRLRTDVSWHDGTPTTAHDVAFTFDRIKDPAVPFPTRTSFDAWEAAQVVDPHTIRFTLRPHADYLDGWAATPILPRHILGDVPPAELPNHPFGTSAPVGNGPFRFVERIPGDRWTFEANPDFPEALGGRPYLDRLVYRTIPSETTLFAELRSGGVQLIIKLLPEYADRTREDAGLELVTFESPNFSFVAWNSRRPFFSDPVVRRALTMAIDREEIIQVVRHGLGTIATGPLGPWHWAYDPDWRPLPFSPDSAAVLLDAAGWTDQDGDGVREKDGVPFSFEISVHESRERQSIAELLQRYLAVVGVEATPRTREYQSLVADVLSPERRFDAFILSWSQGLVVDDRDLWSCQRIGQPLQFTSFCNTELDIVMDSIPIAGDRELQRSLYRRYSELVAEEQPVTFLYDEESVDAMAGDLQGFAPDIRGELIGVAQWWLLDAEAGAAASQNEQGSS